ncbi:serine/threonine-protein kinase Sgk2-like [Limulus polyphemus]|uniref:Serine/threonine-protein kinase Sgk2-like n=1 Tax=Limulus polyphemus TaxID=6850 RepID=A0ABM1S705_LIMPO|nr:serine/threonine-protein kinase Sgk2-like [Limulus polyphemus]XP_022239409.1 serine/threonine-protein kinase Sgk2-like [Limulus polyphemus]XP_022239410.1 serine/threonine-protein kinase Sgk2-like [Limulus polyphemus]
MSNSSTVNGTSNQNGSISPTSASVTNFETREKKRLKYTVYKVLVTAGGKTWFVFRRYNEFCKLQENLKKDFPGLHIKLPGKKFFGNNFSSDLISKRRQGLDEFVQKLFSDQQLISNPEVREFLNLSRNVDNNEVEDDQLDEAPDTPTTPESPVLPDFEKIDKPVDLGPTEKNNVKPSDFEFLKVIGKGSFGKVLLAKHKTEGNVYAVKVLQKKIILKKNEKNHIMSERNVLLKNLEHPFLVGLNYSFQTTDKLYFVLDYINGGEVFFHLQRERYFPEPRARFYAAEIVSALGYLHSNGIVYRDLKPENILLDSQGHVVLTDFGLCKEGLRGKDTTSTFCGTPEYLAPEVLRKEAYDKSVDWWCLGAVLYEMMYGLPPFYSRNTSEMYDNILHKPLRLRTNISVEARNILEALLQKNKEKRLGSKNDSEDVKNHEFFKTVNWNQLEARQVPPPYNPNVNGELDLKNIDPEFIKEPVPASVGKSQGMSASVQDVDTAFQGFSYAPPLYLDN